MRYKMGGKEGVGQNDRCNIHTRPGMGCQILPTNENLLVVGSTG